jgi:hypothetical protein
MRTGIAMVIGLGVIVLGLAGVVLAVVATWPVLAVGLPVLLVFLVASTVSDRGREVSGRSAPGPAATDEDGQVAGR